MCHESFGSDVWLKEQLALELLEEGDRAEDDLDAAEEDGTPGFLNETRETDVEILTDGRGE